MMRLRTYWALEALAAVLALLVLGVLLAAAIVINYPTATDRLLLPLIARSPSALSLVTTVQEALAAVLDRAGQGYEYRIRGPLQGVFQHESPDDERWQASAVRAPADSDCRPCHPDYAQKVRFTRVYFEHGKHSQVERGCGACHVQHSVGRSPLPLMDRCAGCHEETRDHGACVTCHPPGTIFHGASQAADRELGEQCVVCHPRGRPQSSPRTHTMPALGKDEDSCLDCHDSDLCADCHPSGHSEDYARDHTLDLSARRVAVSECWGCHSTRWCATTCHSSGARGVAPR